MTENLLVMAPQPTTILADDQLVIVGGYYGYPADIVSGFFGGVFVSGSHPCWKQLWEEDFRGDTLVFEDLPLELREAWNVFRMNVADDDNLLKAKLGIWRDMAGENLLLVACLPDDRYCMLAAYGPEATLDTAEMARRLGKVYKSEPCSRAFRFEKNPRLPDGEWHMYMALAPLLGLIFSVGNRMKVERVFSFTYFDYAMLFIMLVVIPMRYLWRVYRRRQEVPPIQAVLSAVLAKEATK